ALSHSSGAGERLPQPRFDKFRWRRGGEPTTKSLAQLRNRQSFIRIGWRIDKQGDGDRLRQNDELKTNDENIGRQKLLTATATINWTKIMDKIGDENIYNDKIQG
uniref:Uncharacterized protein n=1 Tax=Romanomermis culicivorax TaxID=13658 RepID=A0A915JET3_ROMCU